MLKTTDYDCLKTHFIRPADDALTHCEHKRSCPGLSDRQWLQMGIERSIKECRTGRGFLQDWAMVHSEGAIGVSHFFETLKSQRRLDLITEVNTRVATSMPSHQDSQIEDLEDLSKVDVYAGDGHYHKTSTHERLIKGKRRAVGHFYTQNLRTHALTHLTSADHEGGRKKAEHDMHALKRMTTEQLRQGAPKGRQVLYVWDCAGIDIPQWHRWKQSAGIYFLSRAKDLFKFTFYGEIDFDREDPINRGVIADQLVTNASSQVTFRYIKYRCPNTGLEYEFVTNHMKIRPGVLAWLYKRRWDIEKTYDTFKNKMNECKAWARSVNAMTMQAQFLCLAHNLMLLMESELKSEQQIINHKEIRRAEQRGHQAEESATRQSRSDLTALPEPLQALTVVFEIYSLAQTSSGHELTIRHAAESLRMVYATFRATRLGHR